MNYPYIDYLYYKGYRFYRNLYMAIYYLIGNWINELPFLQDYHPESPLSGIPTGRNLHCPESAPELHVVVIPFLGAWNPQGLDSPRLGSHCVYLSLKERKPRESGHEGLRKLQVSSWRRGYRMGVHLLPVVPILLSYHAARTEKSAGLEYRTACATFEEVVVDFALDKAADFMTS